MNASSKAHLGVGAVVVVLLSTLVVAPAGRVAAQQGGPKPTALCKFVASTKDADDQTAVSFAPSQASASLAALRKAVKATLPREVKQAIKRLLPLYQELAREGAGDALGALDRYATQHCGYKQSGDINACGLVSLDEAVALAGTPLELLGEYTESCTYAGLPGGPTASVEIYIGDSAQGVLGVDNRDGQLPVVPDLGDEAYLKSSGDIIYFQQSGVWVVIRVNRYDGLDRSQPLLDLARTAVAKI
jgi:hypothetical protein